MMVWTVSGKLFTKDFQVAGDGLSIAFIDDFSEHEAGPVDRNEYITGLAVNFCQHF